MPKDIRWDKKGAKCAGLIDGFLQPRWPPSAPSPSPKNCYNPGWTRPSPFLIITEENCRFKPGSYRVLSKLQIDSKYG
jgi:hypothetical protein